MSSSGGSAPKTVSKVTTDHEEIKQWVESRGGHPASVKRTMAGGPGIIRIDFPGYSGRESLEPISWDDFFHQFDERHLAFLYQDKTASGRPSRFNKIISEDTAEEAAGKQRPSLKRSGSKK